MFWLFKSFLYDSSVFLFSFTYFWLYNISQFPTLMDLYFLRWLKYDFTIFRKFCFLLSLFVFFIFFFFYRRYNFTKDAWNCIKMYAYLHLAVKWNYLDFCNYYLTDGVGYSTFPSFMTFTAWNRTKRYI